MLIELTDTTTARPMLVNTAHIATVRSVGDGSTRSNVLLRLSEGLAVVATVAEPPDVVLLRARNADPRHGANSVVCRAMNQLTSKLNLPPLPLEDTEDAPLRFEPIVPPLRRPQRTAPARGAAARGPGRHRGR